MEFNLAFLVKLSSANCLCCFCLQAKAQEALAGQEEALLEAAETARLSRKAQEESPAARALAARKRALDASLEQETDEARPRRRARSWKIAAKRSSGSSGGSSSGGASGGEEDEEYGGGNKEASQQYLDELSA